MSAERLHVVFGTGQVGRALADRLTGLGLPVRVLSRHRPTDLAEGIEWQAVDASDPDAATAAAEGAAVVYQCLNAPYAKWPELFPPLQRGVLSAAERNDALLVSLENVYAYGPTGGRPMTEDLPLAARTVKGRTRAAMSEELLAAAQAGRVRIAIGRASDFFGPGVTETTLGERAVGGVWHLPGPETVSTREVLELIAAEVGHPVSIRSVPKLALRALGLFNPTMRGLAEMAYEFEEPFLLDTSRYESTFGATGTALATAVGSTVSWHRSRSGASVSSSDGRTSSPTAKPTEPALPPVSGSGS